MLLTRQRWNYYFKSRSIQVFLRLGKPLCFREDLMVDGMWTEHPWAIRHTHSSRGRTVRYQQNSGARRLSLINLVVRFGRTWNIRIKALFRKKRIWFALYQWFSIFLTLWLWCSSSCCGDPSHKFFLLLLCNCKFATAMNYSVNICVSPCS